MLAKVPKLRRNISSAVLLVTAIALISCATQAPPRLVSDPDERGDSAIPWNKQEKWEMAPAASAGLGPTGSSDTR